MKKFVFIIVLFCASSLIRATWKIKQIVNHSDLTVLSASYTKPTKKKIGYLTKKIKQATGAIIDFDYAVHQRSSGCSRIDLSGGYYLALDGPSVTAIKWDRKKANQKNAGKDVLDLNKDHYAARVFLEHENLNKPLIHAVHSYNKEDTYFDIVLSGRNGQYVVLLKNIWDK